MRASKGHFVLPLPFDPIYTPSISLGYRQSQAPRTFFFTGASAHELAFTGSILSTWTRLIPRLAPSPCSFPTITKQREQNLRHPMLLLANETIYTTLFYLLACLSLSPSRIWAHRLGVFFSHFTDSRGWRAFIICCAHVDCPSWPSLRAAPALDSVLVVRWIGFEGTLPMGLLCCVYHSSRILLFAFLSFSLCLDRPMYRGSRRDGVQSVQVRQRDVLAHFCMYVCVVCMCVCVCGFFGGLFFSTLLMGVCERYHGAFRLPRFRI